MATKTVLIVAYYFPPIAASGSMRPLGFCRYLEKYGWRPRVLTTDSRSVYPSAGTDESLSKQLPDTIRIDRVPHKNPERPLLLARDKLRGFFCNSLSFGNSQLNLGGSRDTLGEAAAGMRAQYIAMRKAMLEWLFSFPDPQCFWLQPAIQRLSRVPPKECPDVVFATASPWTGLLVGKALAKKFGVPFVADFRDPWTHNPNRKPFSTLLFQKHRKLEKSICAAATKIIANTEELGAQFRRDNPTLEHKFITITNGFDGSCAPSSELSNKKHRLSNPSSKPFIELCHFGSVYGNRNPLPLLLAVKSLLQDNRIAKSQLRLLFVGDWIIGDEFCDSLAQELERNEVLQRHPSVPHDVCRQQIALAQILLVLQPAYPLQVPAKIYEYLAAGRPIVLIGGEGATAALVERHQLGKCCPNEVSAIRQMLLFLINGKLQIPSPTREQREKFHYRNLTRKLADILDAVTMRDRRELPLG
jgi:glycosyltransferase involved in cell wall biosynthesis